MIKALKIIGYIAGAVGSVWVAFKVVDAIQDSQTDRLEIQQSDSAAQAKYILESTAREEHMVAVVSNTSRKMDSLIGVVNNNHEATINNGLAIIDLINKDTSLTRQEYMEQILPIRDGIEELKKKDVWTPYGDRYGTMSQK